MNAREWQADQAFGDQIQRDRRAAVEAERTIAEALARLHQFSSRPCQTCTAASALLDRPFGCSARARR